MPEQTSSTEHQFAMPKPSTAHERLKPFEGTFRAKVKIWMGPGEPQESSGTMQNSFQLNGLYLHQDFVGDRMDGPFPSFRGKGYWGFNTAVGKYEGFWIDNASSMMQLETGDVDAEGKVWTMYSELINPRTGQPMKRRSIVTLVDDDHHTMEMFFAGPDGKDVKSMEISYQRSAS